MTWTVHVTGPDDVLPATSRLDAMDQAHAINQVALDQTRGRDEDPAVPFMWATPVHLELAEQPSGLVLVPGSSEADLVLDLVETAWPQWASAGARGTEELRLLVARLKGIEVRGEAAG